MSPIFQNFVLQPLYGLLEFPNINKFFLKIWWEFGHFGKFYRNIPVILILIFIFINFFSKFSDGRNLARHRALREVAGQFQDQNGRTHSSGGEAGGGGDDHELCAAEATRGGSRRRRHVGGGRRATAENGSTTAHVITFPCYVIFDRDRTFWNWSLGPDFFLQFY